MRPAPLASESFDRWFEQELSALAEAVVSSLGSNLVALILGGGYGRGEGAVVRRQAQERPYNDLDLFLVVRSVRRLPGLSSVSREFEHRLGVDVDFSRPLTPVMVAMLPHRLMWHDLMRGHRVLWGPADYLRSLAPGYLLDPPPAGEATRLLLNRGIGLLRADRVQKGWEPGPDSDFVRRNVYKTALALGDSIFLEHGILLPPIALRAQALRKFGVEDPLLTLYEAAIEFKLAPDRCASLDTEALLALWEQRFTSLLQAGVHDPEANRSDQWLKNLLRNIRTGRLSSQHPRACLYSLLPSIRTEPRRWGQLFKIWSLYH